MRKARFFDTLRKGKNKCNLENLQIEEQMFHRKTHHLFVLFSKDREMHIAFRMRLYIA